MPVPCAYISRANAVSLTSVGLTTGIAEDRVNSIHIVRERFCKNSSHNLLQPFGMTEN
jgi:hypothetical protein